MDLQRVPNLVMPTAVAPRAFYRTDESTPPVTRWTIRDTGDSATHLETKAVGCVMPQGPAEPRTLETRILGRPVTFRYSETWVGGSLLAGRLIMAYIFVMAGLEKILDPEWTAAGYLQFAVHEDNPFREVFLGMAGSAVVDQLVIWGLLLTGLGILFGLALRWCAFWASVIMVFFWASSLQGGLLQGLPVAHGYIVTYHLVYVVLLFALAAFGAGRVLGVDARLERSAFVEKAPWLRYVLG